MLRRSSVFVRCVSRYSTTIEKWVNNVVTETVKLSNGSMELKTGHMARFADGSATATNGNSTILATVVTTQPDENVPPPISNVVSMGVDFLQSASAVGRIPMNYLRRELQQSDMDILISRMIDRSIRPLVSTLYSSPIKIVCKPLSVDRNVDIRVLGINAAATAMALSSIPLVSNVAACRIAMINNKVILNPLREQLEESAVDLLISGTSDKKIVMIEMDGNQIKIEQFMECVEKGFQEIDVILTSIGELERQAGKSKSTLNPEDKTRIDEILDEMMDICEDRLTFIFTDSLHDKSSRDKAVLEVKKETVESMLQKCSPKEMDYAFTTLVKHCMRKVTRESGIRVDGRRLDEVRPIFIETDLYPRLHGSSMFQRGQSQVMGTVTFDSMESSFRPDAVAQLLGAQHRKSFMLHYEFPAFSVNQLGESASRFNRRALGHGNLAEKSLKHVIPKDFPYCIRLDCQVFESNGSTSMASVCAGSLALYDAGVKLSSPVAGVAIGLFHPDGDQYTTKMSSGHRPTILTDLMGMEDFAGDMDFKIAGTENGFTGMQFDVSIPGISIDLLHECLRKGSAGISHVLSLMNEALPVPRAAFKESVPVMESISLLGAHRAALFRANGYNAKLIGVETGAQFFAEDEDKMIIMAPSSEDLETAKRMMKDIFKEPDDKWPEFGQMVDAEIVEILERAVVVKLPKVRRSITVPLRSLTIQQISNTSILKLQIGQKIRLKFLGMDPATGNPRLLNLDKFV